MRITPTHRHVGFTEVAYPKAQAPHELPEIPHEVYDERLRLVRERMEKDGFTHAVIYGDREHFANLRFLSGYDPRFEEGLLIIAPDGKPTLVVGNEGLNYAEIAKDVDVVLYAHFSLQGQPRNRGKKLREIFSDTGIGETSKVGLVGVKYMETDEFAQTEFLSDVPSYIVDLLRKMAGNDQVLDITAWFTHPSEGLRIPLSVHEIALYEAANCYVYAGMKRALESMKVGISELEIASLLGFNGMLPLAYHITVGFGKRASMGLASPTERKLKKGDYISFGYGVWGANLSRAGVALESPDEATDMPGVLDKLYAPYFLMLRRWYGTMRVGVTGGEVYEAVKDVVEEPFFGIALNPGHLLRDEEWINAPFAPGSQAKLQSGTAIQCDIISEAPAPYFGIHTEDGLVLADKMLRNQLKELYPEVWQRIVRRRTVMIEQLGYELHEDVLPLSDLQGFVTPYLLNPNLALCYRD